MAHMVPIYGAVIAAAHKKRQEEEEETLMAEFMKDDKSGDWEYKIIRGLPGAFRSETRMSKALEEEAEASWELAMKLDDERMILRRPRKASSMDATLGTGAQPYRTDYGRSTVLVVVAALLLILGVAAFLFTFLLNDSMGATEGYSFIMYAVLGIIVLLGLGIVALKLRR